VTAFRPAIRARGRLAPQNGPEAVTDLAGTGNRRGARTLR
jgi:hypothetical protein